ncbi:MAG: PilN domain-containing protein [Acidobacteriota bacterium]|nr:PilN domain-containing protein [Acidobacteriota bacterium]
MITPSLASRPFLNTRPVWVMTIAAGCIALVLIVLNIHFFLTTNRAVEDEIVTRDALEERFGELEGDAQQEIAFLNRVPWRRLEARVNATNLVLQEHAFSWLQMLDDIERVMPYDVRLTRISPSVGPEGVMLTFEVVARNRDAMLDFIDNLVEDPRFDEPSLANEVTPEDSTTGTYLLMMKVLYVASGEIS